MRVSFDFENRGSEVTVQATDGRAITVDYDSYHTAVQHVRADDVFQADMSRLFDERVGDLILKAAEVADIIVTGAGDSAQPQLAN